MASNVSTHQLVGCVTKMYPAFGYINNEIFFYRKNVIGPMVDVGDNVATSAVYQPHMPIKWSAEKVWKVEENTGKFRRRGEEEFSWRSKSPQGRLTHSHHKYTEHENNKPYEVRRSERGRESRERDYDYEKNFRDIDRRRPMDHKHATSSITNFNKREYLFFELQKHFPTVLPPINLYRVKCGWQESFPFLKPFQPNHACTFQIVQKEDDILEPTGTDNSFYANVLLLSLPSFNDLMEKIVVPAEDPDRTRGSLRKYIKILACSKQKRLSGIGGPWCPELDGPNPLTNPQTLINTAIRVCKNQIGLDLSYCTQWHRFLEFRYSRTEGSTAQPTSVLFPSSQLWGRSFVTSANDTKPPTKPFHRIVVYYLPNIWTLMPDVEEWSSMKTVYEKAFISKGICTFPVPSALGNSTGFQTSNTDQCNKSVDAKCSNDKQMIISNQTAMEEDETINLSESSFKPMDSEVLSDNAGDTSNLLSGDNKLEDADLDTTFNCEATDAKSPFLQGASVQEDQKKSNFELNMASMKVSELREELKNRGLPTDGIKAHLVNRLKSAVEEEADNAKHIEQQGIDHEIEENLEHVDTSKSVGSESHSENTSKFSLRDTPSVIVQTHNNYSVQCVGLDVVMDMKSDYMSSSCYEFMFCVQTIFDMFRRDSIFTLFRALVNAGDRGVVAKPIRRSDWDYASKRPCLEHNDRSSVSRDEHVTKDVPFYTTDLPLLFACTILDSNSKNYFSSSEIEDLILSLGLPISRYQLRSMIYKVLDHNRIHYRSLTDGPEPLTMSNKSLVIYSDIDDDEYLVELIRGGDAILDENVDNLTDDGSILVLRKSGPDDSGTAVKTTNEVFNELRLKEKDESKLLLQLKVQEQELIRLRASVKEVSILKEEIKRMSSSANSYRIRYRDEKEQLSLVIRAVDQQALVLDSCRSALRQTTKRVSNRQTRNRSSSPSGSLSSLSKKREVSIEPKKVQAPTHDASGDIETMKTPEPVGNNSQIAEPDTDSDINTVSTLNGHVANWADSAQDVSVE